jgi:hypothetical protein
MKTIAGFEGLPRASAKILVPSAEVTKRPGATAEMPKFASVGLIVMTGSTSSKIRKVNYC